MGTIKNIRVISRNNIEYTVTAKQEENLLLKGHKTNAHVFSEEAAQAQTRVKERGNSRYLQVPKTLCEGINKENTVRCLRKDSEGKIIFFYGDRKIERRLA